MKYLEEEHARLKDRTVTMTLEEVESLGVEAGNTIVAELLSVVKKHSASLLPEFLLDLEKMFETLETKGEGGEKLDENIEG